MGHEKMLTLRLQTGMITIIKDFLVLHVKKVKKRKFKRKEKS